MWKDRVEQVTLRGLYAMPKWLEPLYLIVLAVVTVPFVLIGLFLSIINRRDKNA